MSSRRTRSSATAIKNESDTADNSITVKRQSLRSKKEGTTLSQVGVNRIPRPCRTRSNPTLSENGNHIGSKPIKSGTEESSISGFLESCTSSILNDLDLIPENDPHYSEINGDVFEKSDSGVSPEKVEAKPLRRSARAASVASSEKKIKTPTRNRSVRAASKDIDNSESGLHDVDPKRTQRACGRVTRSSSFVASDTSDLEESVSFLTKSIRRTPARGVNNDNLNVIKEESLENSGINSVNTEFPMKTNAEVTITPSKRGRSAKTTRLSVKKISASPPRLTRAMRAAGLTTPVQEKELDIVQSAEVLENINDSKQVVVASGEKLHNKERFDLETPIRERNEKFSKNLIHMLMNSTGKERKQEKLHTPEVKVNVEVPQSVLGVSTPENEIEYMDWESMETPVSQKRKVIPTSNDTTPLTHPTSGVDSANVYTPLITKSTDEHERFVEIITQSVEKANQIMGKGNKETPREFGTKEIKNNPDSVSSEPVDLIHTTTSNEKQPEEYRRSIGTNENRESSINQESFNLVNDTHSVSSGLKNGSNDAGLSKEIDSNEINEIAQVMQGAGSDESLAECGVLLFSTVECNSNSTLSGLNNTAIEAVPIKAINMDDKVEHDTAELEPNEQDECVSNQLSEEISVYMKENEINCDSKVSKTCTIPDAVHQMESDMDEENIPVVEEQLTESDNRAKAKSSDTTLTVVTEQSQLGDEAGSSSSACRVERYPKLDSFKQLFKKPKACHRSIDTALPLLYTFACELKRRVDDLPSNFLNKNDETVWQFIAYRNKQISKEYRKQKDFLDEVIDHQLTSSNDEDEDEEENEMEYEQEEEIVDEEEDVDLFNLKGEDLHDIERQLEEEADDNSEEGDKNIESLQKTDYRQLPHIKYPKSAVDDKFFSLAEMDAFLDEAEKQNDEEEILTTVDDTWGDTTDYRYEDFFGKLEDVITNDKQGKKEKKIKRKATNEDPLTAKKNKKTVRFALDEDIDNVVETVVDSQEFDDTHDQSVLLGEGAKEADKKESSLKRSLKKLKETIKKLEDENLAPRSWELSGEVTGQQREENTLLETHVQFDHGAKKAPEITEDFTEKLEGIIKQRIKDRTFDDVIRKKRVEERLDVYRNQAIEENEMIKKSLTEVYEKEYLKATGEVKDDEKPNEQHEAIEKQMRGLFRLVDALSHYEYTPPEVRPEVKIVSNISALRIEEVGMMASTDAQLLAPEEMKKREKGVMKADDERDRTDKLRQRRKKKNKQRAMVMIMGENAIMEQKRKKDKHSKSVVDKGSSDTLKSSTFFNKLQDTVQEELKEKTTRKKKVKSEVVLSGGSKFKL